MDLPNSSVFFSGLAEKDDLLAEQSTSNLLNDDSSSSIFDMLCATSNTQTFHSSLLDDIELDLQCDEDSVDLSACKPLYETIVHNFIKTQKSVNKESLTGKESSNTQYGSNHFSGSFEKLSEISFPLPSDKMIRCFICQIQFSTQKSYLKHREDKHIKHELFPHECLPCGESFLNKRSLTKHNKAHHFKKLGKTNILFQCPQCLFSGRTKSILKEHIRVKHDPKTFSCSQCSFSCLQERTLTLHQLKHEGDPKFACDQCGKLFLAMSILKRHAHTHNKIRSHICKVPECGKSFTMKSRLTDHIRTVHNHKTHNRSCDSNMDKRKKRFVQRQNFLNSGDALGNQMKNICEEVSKVIQNEVTNKNLVKTTSTNEIVVYDIVLSNENLKLLHSLDVDKHSSSSCTSPCITAENGIGIISSEDNLLSVSSEEIPMQAIDKKCVHSVNQSKNDQLVVSKKFFCSWEGCNKSFRDRYNLRTHMCTHSGEMQRSCSLCRYRCIQKSAMDAHMKRHERSIKLRV